MSGDESLDERRALLAEAIEQRLEQGLALDERALALAHGVTQEEVRRVARALAALVQVPDPAPARELPRPQLPPNYELLDELGRGGMGVVYRCLQRDLGREVAVKVLMPGELAAGESLARFRREMRSLARVIHPHVVRILEVGEHAGRVYYAMDLVQGESLAHLLRRRRPSVTESVRLVTQVADAMAAVHARGLVHRDLKPANVLVDGEGEAFVVDFGLAYDEREAGLTRTGHLLGTPAYMSPEQARGAAAEVGERSDVHALGAILYECLTGEAPFGDRPLVELIQAVAEEPPPRPSRRNRRVPQELDWVVARAMAKDPADRYPTMRALLEDLERFARGEAVRAAPPNPLDLMRRWAGRHRATLVSATLTAVAALVVFLVFVRPQLAGTDRLLQEARYWAARGGEADRETAGSLYVRLAQDDVALQPEEELLALRHRLGTMADVEDARRLAEDTLPLVRRGQERDAHPRRRRRAPRVDAAVLGGALWVRARALVRADDGTGARQALEELLEVPLGPWTDPQVLDVELRDLAADLARERAAALPFAALLLEVARRPDAVLAAVGRHAAGPDRSLRPAVERLLTSLGPREPLAREVPAWLELVAPLGRREALRVLATARDGQDPGAARGARALAARVMDLPPDPDLDGWALFERPWPTELEARIELVAGAAGGRTDVEDVRAQALDLARRSAPDRLEAWFPTRPGPEVVHRALVLLDPEPSTTPVFRRVGGEALLDAWAERLGVPGLAGHEVLLALLHGSDEASLELLDLRREIVDASGELGPVQLGVPEVGYRLSPDLRRPLFLTGVPADPPSTRAVEVRARTTWTGTVRGLAFEGEGGSAGSFLVHHRHVLLPPGSARPVLEVTQHLEDEEVHTFAVAWLDPPEDLEPTDVGAWLAAAGEFFPAPEPEPAPEPRTPEQVRKDRRLTLTLGGLVGFVLLSVGLGVVGGLRSLARRGVDRGKVLRGLGFAAVCVFVVGLQSPQARGLLPDLWLTALMAAGALSAVAFGWGRGGAATWVPGGILLTGAVLTACAQFALGGEREPLGRLCLAWATLAWPVGVVTLALPSVGALERFVRQEPRLVRNVWIGLLLLEGLPLLSALGLVLWTSTPEPLSGWGLGLARWIDGNRWVHLLREPAGLWVVMFWFQWRVMMPVNRMEMSRQRLEQQARRAAESRPAPAGGA